MISRAERASQRSQILKLLISARGDWVPLPRILELKISQFGARILEARRLGFKIENKTGTVEGKKHSWYRLVLGTEEAPTTPAAPAPESRAPSSFPEFGRLTPERYGVD